MSVLRQETNFNTTNRSNRLAACGGFSLIELIVSMALTLVMLSAAVMLFNDQLKSRQYQSSKGDAITSAQAAINILSREIGNSGYGLKRGLLASNGLVFADCNASRLHYRANTDNTNAATSDPGEDVTFFYDATSQSIVRYDNANGGSSAGIINQVSNVRFVYYNYASNGTFAEVSTPTDQTARVTIRLTVLLGGNINSPRNVTVESDIALRNSQYGVGQY